MGLTLQEAIWNKYIQPTERKTGAHVGVELEFPLVNLSRRPVNVPAVQEVVKGFAERFQFTKQTRDDNGNLYSLTEPVTGDNLSFDCSFNTLELSFGKEVSIVLLFERFVRYFEDLQEHFRKIGHLLTGLGIHPYYKYNDYVPIANTAIGCCTIICNPTGITLSAISTKSPISGCSRRLHRCSSMWKRALFCRRSTR